MFLVLSMFVLAMPQVSLAQDEPSPDAAAEEDEEDQAAKHFSKGRKLYGEGKYNKAIEELLKAYELRPAPPILLNIARTYEKLRKKKEALKYYKEFLQKARLVDPNRPQVEAVVKKLEREVKGTTGAVTSAAGTETPEAGPGEEGTPMVRSRHQQLIHTPVDSAKVNQPITIMAKLPPRTEVDRVVLYIRRGGETRFHEIPMELQGETYVAKIPAMYVTSTSLQYFLQALKGTGKGSVRAEAGTKTTPHIVVIEGGRAPNLGPVEEIDITSPYRTWVWVSASASVAFIGGGVGFALLARDRESAIERWADEKSCQQPCQDGKVPPRLTFDNKARDWESEGQTFALLGKLFIGLGIASAGAFGALLYLDRKYVKEERARLGAGQPALSERSTRPRLMAAPWAGPTGAGLVGSINF